MSTYFAPAGEDDFPVGRVPSEVRQPPDGARNPTRRGGLVSGFSSLANAQDSEHRPTNPIPNHFWDSPQEVVTYKIED